MLPTTAYPMPRSPHAAAFLAMALLLSLFSAAQYNDPDGPLWTLVYGLPAAASALLALRGRLIASDAFLLAAAPLLVAAPPLMRAAVTGLQRSGMSCIAGVEECRELAGATIAAGWLLVVWHMHAAAAPESAEPHGRTSERKARAPSSGSPPPALGEVAHSQAVQLSTVTGTLLFGAPAVLASVTAFWVLHLMAVGRQQAGGVGPASQQLPQHCNTWGS